MTKEYREIRRQIEDAGFFTSEFQMDGFVCASRSYLRGNSPRLGGKSFWVAERQGRWFVSNWGSSFYEIPDVARVAQFCITCLRDPDEQGFIQDALRADFSLVELTEDEFGALDRHGA